MAAAWLAANLTVTKELMTLAADPTCHDVNSLNESARCAFAQGEACDYDGVIYSYTELTYCQLGNLRAVAILVLVLVLFMLFVAIGSVADDFLCPSLLTISKTFRLPDHIAGVTFLAFGNGAPDIFSSIGGIRDSKPQLIFSSLFGAGIFVTTVVTGSVMVTGEFALMRRPVMRDIIFYIGAAYMVWFFIFRGLLQIGHSIALLCWYLVFISVIIISRLIYVRMNPNKNSAIEATLDDGTVEDPSIANGASTSTNRLAVESLDFDNRSIPSGPSSRRQSINSLQEKARKRTPSEDEVILSRFHRTGTLTSSRRRSRADSQRYYAHHHLENVITQIEKNYDTQRKLGNVEDVRYKDVIEKEEARKEKKRVQLAQLEADRLEQQQKKGYVNDIQLNNHSERPTYKSQMSTVSIWSIQSMQEFAFGEGKDFLIHISPVDILEWTNYPWYRKGLEIVKAIPYFLMTVCIPVVDLESPNENWCRLLTCLNIICAPQAILFLTKVQYSFAGIFPLWAAFLILSPIVSLAIFFTSQKETPPFYHRVLGFIGFAVSVIFVNSIAEEVIAVLTTFGVIFDLSDSILGLTVLAWGNSLGDLISDITMARHGYPGMAISACFGGQMMNLVLGLGLPYTILFAGGDKSQVEVPYTPMMTLLFTTLMISLCISLFTFVLRRFHSSKVHGIVLLCIYVVYLTLAMLIEFKVIFKNADSPSE